MPLQLERELDALVDANHSAHRARAAEHSVRLAQLEQSHAIQEALTEKLEGAHGMLVQMKEKIGALKAEKSRFKATKVRHSSNNGDRSPSSTRFVLLTIGFVLSASNCFVPLLCRVVVCVSSRAALEAQRPRDRRCCAASVVCARRLLHRRARARLRLSALRLFFLISSKRS